MGVADWRAWTDQNGGTLPTAPNPPGTPWQINQAFPGVNPITDLISGTTSIPPYPSLSNPGNFSTVNAIDPFYVGTYPTGGGWVNLMERYTPGTPSTPTWPAGSPGASVPAGPIMRPVVAGITS
jgi:hypothetical protein